LTARPARRFWFILAQALGATVGELQQRMSSSEFSEWQVLYQLDPFGNLRGDFQAGQIASTVVNLFRDKTDPVLSPAAFLLPSPWNNATDTTIHRHEQQDSPAPGSREETELFLAAMGAVRKEKT